MSVELGRCAAQDFSSAAAVRESGGNEVASAVGENGRADGEGGSAGVPRLGKVVQSVLPSCSSLSPRLGREQ